MPVFRNRTAFEIARGVRAFLNLDVGLVRGEPPDFEKQFMRAKDQAKKHRLQLERLRERLSNKDQQLEQMQRRLSESAQRVAALQAGSDANGAGTQDLLAKDSLDPLAEQAGITRFPPPPLRHRIHSASHDIGSFLEVGKRCSQDIEAVLKKIGKDFDSFQNVLDFGCGCGRTLVWFKDRSVHLYGTDIDAEAISWCRDNFDFAEFSANEPLPPLEYPSETFDFVYALSVFTHLDEEYQFRWLDELKRVTRPGGIVLLTVHGRFIWKEWKVNSYEEVADIEKRGLKFVVSGEYEGMFPEWYQDTYHTEEYVLDRYSKYFDVLEYIPRGMDNYQDAVVLQKP